MLNIQHQLAELLVSIIAQPVIIAALPGQVWAGFNSNTTQCSAN